MKVSELPVGQLFSLVQDQKSGIYMKVAAKFGETLLLEVIDDNAFSYRIPSEDSAAIHWEGKDMGKLVFLPREEVELV